MRNNDIARKSDDDQLVTLSNISSFVGSVSVRKMQPNLKQLFCFSLALVSVVSADNNNNQNKNDKNKKKILSFGGNGNIGSEVLHRLINDPSGEYEIYLVSRGNWHWDSAVRIMPFVTHISCDRELEDGRDLNPLRKCQELVKIIGETKQFHAVLDFSGYDPKWIHDALDVLQDQDDDEEGKARVYVYVSSDSVYEVCKEKEPKDRKSVESDAVRPEDEKEQERLNEADNYGDLKLAGEEVLRERRNSGSGYPYVALRFADVIGPRDTTFRWYIYQIWLRSLRHLEDVPLPIPEHVSEVKSSLTHVADAALSVISAMEASPDAWDESYNVALEEEFNLRDILRKMAAVLGTDEKLLFDETPEDQNFHLYPTVFRGPIDVSKAKLKLGFAPMSSDEAFAKTVEWYEEAFLSMEEEREEALSRFSTYVLPRDKKKVFFAAVDRELAEHGINRIKKRTHEEL